MSCVIPWIIARILYWLPVFRFSEGPRVAQPWVARAGTTGAATRGRSRTSPPRPSPEPNAGTTRWTAVKATAGSSSAIARDAAIRNAVVGALFGRRPCSTSHRIRRPKGRIHGLRSPAADVARCGAPTNSPSLPIAIPTSCASIWAFGEDRALPCRGRPPTSDFPPLEMAPHRWFRRPLEFKRTTTGSQAPVLPQIRRLVIGSVASTAGFGSP
jgi:hypothetical protein